jgi:DNA-binding CsgD family transcriptional regulator
LAEEFLERAKASGYHTARATASAAASAVPFGAIAHLLPAGIDLNNPVKSFAQVAEALTAEHGRRAARRMVCIDDLQLLDASSALLIRQLMDSDMLRLICTVRRGTAVSESVAALCTGDSACRIDLAPFDAAQVEVVLRRALGGPVARGTARTFAEISGGNALYLRELVHGSVADGSLACDREVQIWRLAGPDVAATPALTELIEARLAAASADSMRALELLALCEPLPLEDLQAVATAEQLDQLESSGLIAVTTDNTRTEVKLAHPLYGRCLASGIPELRRRRLLSEQIERTKRHTSGPHRDARRFAAWQLAATGSADPGSLIQAAVIAMQAHDHRQALELLEALPDTAQSPEIRLLIVQLLLEQGRSERAEQVLASARAEAHGDDQLLSLVLGRIYESLWRAGSAEAATALIESVRPHIVSAEGRRALRYADGAMRIVSGDLGGGLALLEDLPLAREAGLLEAVRKGATYFKVMALRLEGRIGESKKLAAAIESGGLAQLELPLPAFGAMPLMSGAGLAVSGRLTEARAVSLQAYDELAGVESQVPRALAAADLGKVEWLLGRPGSARRWLAEAAALARGHGSVHLLRETLSTLAACAAVLGDHDAAEKAAADCAEYPQAGLGMAWGYLGPAWVAAMRGELVSARAVLNEAAQQARAVGNHYCEAVALGDAARLGAADEVAGRLGELADVCEGEFVPALAQLAAALAAGDAEKLLAAGRDLHGLGVELMAGEAAAAAAAAWQRAGETRKQAAAQQLVEEYTRNCEGARTPLLISARSAAHLTARQREIALMAANGIPSREIAEALQLSVRTVDSHLNSVYTKLGVTTRRQLADALGTGRHPLSGEAARR